MCVCEVNTCGEYMPGVWFVGVCLVLLCIWGHRRLCSERAHALRGEGAGAGGVSPVACSVLTLQQTCSICGRKGYRDSPPPRG